MNDQAAEIQELQQQLQHERQLREQLETQLQEALWQAESAQRAKESFVANMNHELHTPLSAILGFAELLNEDVKNGYYEGMSTDLAKIIQAGMQLLSRINELLDLSKLEADKMHVHITEFTVRNEIERVVEQLRPLLTEQGNTITVYIDEDITTMQGDAAKVRQILSNLLDNANKFTVEGTIKLLVRGTKINDVAHTEFEIEDSGIGIAPEHLERIFHAFTQADPSATRHYEGMGLGLHICQQLCHLMQGEISVESKAGEGAAFRFWLPTKLEPARYQRADGE